MLSLHSYLIYCGAYALAIAVPGPGVIAIVARALGSGFRSTLPAVLGTVVGDWILMSLCAFGLAAAAQAMGGLFLVVKILGGAYLIYLGFRYWTAQPTRADAPPATGRQGFVSQLALTLGNPKAIAFFVALLPSAIDLKALTVTGYLELSAATVVLIPAIELTYAGLAARMAGFLGSPKALRRLNKSAGVIVAGAGACVALS